MVSESIMDSCFTPSVGDFEKQKSGLKKQQNTTLTYKQTLRQDAMLWAEFLYSEYSREKALREGAPTVKPTYYDDTNA